MGLGRGKVRLGRRRVRLGWVRVMLDQENPLSLLSQLLIKV